MQKHNFLIYGSYGYTGKLIAELAIQQGLNPLLGGRNKDKLSEQAKQLNLDYRVFDLESVQAIKQGIHDVVSVIHCAGPFVDTYENMAQACIETGTHYLDITGEVAVIEGLAKKNVQAQTAHIMLLPGAGFDVVPSDCLALHLKNRMPDATELILAISSVHAPSTSGRGISRGTARSMLKGMSAGSLIRDAGVLKEVSLGFKKRLFNFGDNQETMCMTISWGDLASAWWSTRIPHIETYMEVPNAVIFMYRLINPIKFIFKWRLLQRYLQNKVNAMPEGPDREQREHSILRILGQAKNAQGDQVTAFVKTPNGYDFTAMAVLTIVKKTLTGNAPIGFQTPATAYGEKLILEMNGTTLNDI